METLNAVFDRCLKIAQIAQNYSRSVHSFRTNGGIAIAPVPEVNSEQQSPNIPS
jgi:hypothetical protein